MRVSLGSVYLLIGGIDGFSILRQTGLPEEKLIMSNRVGVANVRKSNDSPYVENRDCQLIEL